MPIDPTLQNWQQRYEQNDTPWDKGCAAPPLRTFLEKGTITGRVLVPGCGRGHEVHLLATLPGVTAVGLDLSETAIEQARKLTPVSLKNASFQVGDFFELPLDLKGEFDWIVEHTCFCAIDPLRRTDYLRAAVGALRPGGTFLGIFYLTPDTENGPPFPVSREELDSLFSPEFEVVSEEIPSEAFPGREGRELVRVMRKKCRDIRGPRTRVK